MPADNGASVAKSTKRKQRAAKKKQDPQHPPPQQDPMSHSHPLQSQEQFFQQSMVEQQPLQSLHPGQAPGVPSTTPSRKRQGRNNKQNSRNGYHSDTGSTHYGQAPRHHSASQSVDAGHLYAASPAASQAGQAFGTTPPRSTSTPTKQQVYAGPTFLASPAASSLPMPKSIAKTMPSGSRYDSFQSRQEADSRSNDLMFGSPAKRQAAHEGREGSSLEMLFSADRAEKSWKASESASPLSQVRSASHAGAGSTRRERQLGQRSGTPGSASNKEMLMMEMNGNSDESESEEPVKAVPFRERMQAIAEAESPTAQHSVVPDDMDLQRQAKTRALKQLLMGPAIDQHQAGPTELTAPAPTLDRYGHTDDHLHQSQATQQWAATGQRTVHSQKTHEASFQTVRPSAASPSPQELRAMEENLRRVLKLGPSS